MIIIIPHQRRAHLFFFLILFLLISCGTSFYVPLGTEFRIGPQRPTRLGTPANDRRSRRSASSEQSNSDSTTTTADGTSLKKKKTTQQSGVYARPSAAIERGSGFFVPGLEGPKVRFVVGVVLLVSTAINHYYYFSSTTSSNDDYEAGNNFSEGLAIVYSILVLLQAAIEYTKEQKGLMMIEVPSKDAGAASRQRTTTTTYQQQWSMPTDDANAADWRNKVEWAASTYLSLTPATHMMLLGPGKILYSLGCSSSTDEPSSPRDDDEKSENVSSSSTSSSRGCLAALETLSKSKSGRVSLPASHPAVTSLADAEYNRCVVLQSIDQESQLCWMMTSDQLLPAFTKHDLQWLGQLAKYVRPEC